MWLQQTNKKKPERGRLLFNDSPPDMPVNFCTIESINPFRLCPGWYCADLIFKPDHLKHAVMITGPHGAL